MIYGHLDNLARYVSQNPHFQKALDYLNNLPELTPGRNEIDGDNLFANYVDGQHAEGQVTMEAHKKYLDLHFTIEGMDRMGWKATQYCTEINQLYDEKNDVALFTDKPSTWVDIPPNHFAIVFPEDAHAPLRGEGKIKKLILKIKAE